MKRICLVLLVVSSSKSYGQINLVPNPSFEDTIQCPSSSGHVDDCIGWHNVLKTPDYFNICASFPVSIPSNFTGEQMPFNGSAYMGLITYDYYFYWREIIGTKLIDTLIPGMTYHVSMRISRGNATFANYCGYATNKIGIRFTTFEHTLLNPPAINNFAQLYEDTLITDTLNWVLLAWDYIPDSAYTHFYIGNFFDDSNTDTMGIGSLFNQAYYYIDSINLACINCISGIKENKLTKQAIHFNPLTNILNIFYNKYAILSIYDYSGRLIRKDGFENSLILNLNQYRNSVLLIVIEDGITIVSKKIIIN